MLKKLSVIAISAALLSPSAFADIINTSWKTANDNKLFFDTTSGHEFLKLTDTYRNSYDEIMARVNGGDLNGFRFATEAEVIGMFQRNFAMSLAIDEMSDYYSQTQSNTQAKDKVRQAMYRMGITTTDYNHTYSRAQDYTHGLVVREDGSLTHSAGFMYWGGYMYNGKWYDSTVRVFTNSQYSSTAPSNDPSTLNNGNMPATGIFLIAEPGKTYSSINDETVSEIQIENGLIADVSAPFAAGIALMGLMGFGRLRKR